MRNLPEIVKVIGIILVGMLLVSPILLPIAWYLDTKAHEKKFGRKHNNSEEKVK